MLAWLRAQAVRGGIEGVGGVEEGMLAMTSTAMGGESGQP